MSCPQVRPTLAAQKFVKQAKMRFPTSKKENIINTHAFLKSSNFFKDFIYIFERERERAQWGK